MMRVTEPTAPTVCLMVKPSYAFLCRRSISQFSNPRFHAAVQRRCRDALCDTLCLRRRPKCRACAGRASQKVKRAVDRG